MLTKLEERTLFVLLKDTIFGFLINVCEYGFIASVSNVCISALCVCLCVCVCVLYVWGLLQWSKILNPIIIVTAVIVFIMRVFNGGHAD